MLWGWLMTYDICNLQSSGINVVHFMSHYNNALVKANSLATLNSVMMSQEVIMYCSRIPILMENLPFTIHTTYLGSFTQFMYVHVHVHSLSWFRGKTRRLHIGTEEMHISEIICSYRIWNKLYHSILYFTKVLRYSLKHNINRSVYT
jgi:hypothetical protein